ncbi:MAG: lysine biosynthesis protein LysX [Acidobacteriota bacterium]
MTRLCLLVDRIRVEEKLLIRSLERRRDVEFDVVALPDVIFDPVASAERRYDLVLNRTLSLTRGLAALEMLEAGGAVTLNTREVVARCGDKVSMSAALARAGVPQPAVRVATSPEAALRALDELGYPAVLKPAVGSWGRLLARLRDRDAAEALFEHKATLGGPQHGVFYLQAYVEKPGRDLRAFVIGGRTVCAIERRSEHWITNTARGAVTAGVPVDVEMDRICRAAALAVAGPEALIAVDLFESPDGYLVGEVNATMEFRNSIEPTGVDLPSLMVDHAVAVASGGIEARFGAGAAA